MEERAGERRFVSNKVKTPLSPALSPFVPHEEREKRNDDSLCNPKSEMRHFVSFC
jgi:hypothetical protein